MCRDRLLEVDQYISNLGPVFLLPEVSHKTWHQLMLTMYAELLVAALSLYPKRYESNMTHQRVDKMIGFAEERCNSNNLQASGVDPRLQLASTLESYI